MPRPGSFAEQAALRLGWSGRSLHRVLKVARTIADLDDDAHISVGHLAEAMQLAPRAAGRVSCAGGSWDPAVAPSGGPGSPE